MKRMAAKLAVAAFALAGAQTAAAETRIAVATNFTAAAKDVAALFGVETGEQVVLAFGSTGQLFTQIAQGAPFAAFLAADQARPLRAEDEGMAVKGSRFTYAIGQIALYSARNDAMLDAETLKAADFEKLAIANPATAPYGAASIEVLAALGVEDEIRPKLVQGKNVAQALQFIISGAAEYGFIAASQVALRERGSSWLPPTSLYAPIRQDAVLIDPDNETASAFLAFLRSAEAKMAMARYGYRGEE